MLSCVLCACACVCSLSQARLAEVQKELATLEDQLTPLLMKYKQEKERLDKIRHLQNKRQELLVALEMAEQRQDLARIAGRWASGLVGAGSSWTSVWCRQYGSWASGLGQAEHAVLSGGHVTGITRPFGHATCSW